MDKKIYKVFIASPGDTNSEREICDKVFEEINNGLGEIYHFRIESLKWEKDVRPSIQNRDGQSIINDQIGNEYRIFIGIMNKKFGSPTTKAGSGTEEEFNNAFERYKKKGDLEVVFYFNDEPPKSMKELKPEELVKISNFKTKLSGLGIYGEYNSILDFEEKLRKHLTKYFISEFKKITTSTTQTTNNLVNKAALRKIFNKRLSDSLKGFDDQPIVWIEPIISRTGELSQNPDENYNQRVHIEEILHSRFSYIIKAPAQFGLTSLGHHFVKEAWENDELWIFLDNNNTKPHTIHNAVKNEVQSLDQKIEDVKCIVFDSCIAGDKISFKKLSNLIDANPNVRIVVLNSVDESLYTNKNEDNDDNTDIEIDKEFENLHLIALPRNQIRQVVKQYNKVKNIDEDDKVLEKVITDLECLNLHRTPFNCLTILKVAEKYFDDSPVNRTKMIEMILFVLFDMGEIPRYKTKPDLKDCEYVLGKYCELMIRNEQYTFFKEPFIEELKTFCKEKYIDLDVEVVFNVLFKNNIIVYRYGSFCFKSTFWIFYFGAKRMHNDELFKKYIFDTKKYASFPEIVEFYTGIDRNRDDALEILLADITSTCEIVQDKLGIAGEINPLNLAQWKPTPESIEKIHTEISENVLNSKLPDSVKDQFLDKSYDQIRPYNQSIQKIFEEYSLLSLMQKIRASSTALRNSDYANPEIKKKLLKQIYKSWEQLAKVLFALTPIMATKGIASFEGAAFELNGDFGKTFEERLNTIIQALPTNVVGYFKDEIYSPKLGPLFFDNFSNEENKLLLHHQALLLIFKRPNGWKKVIEDYISSLNKNSFYLYDTVNALRTRYRYDFASKEELRDITYLAKMGLAKHEFGGKKPSLNQIVQIADSNLPKRELNLD